MSASIHEFAFTLWSWPASDCSARLRIALALKQIPYNIKDVNLGKGERSETLLNPNQTVPTLLVSTTDLDRKEIVKLTQSVAALEYVEELFPGLTPLLPPINQPEARAAVRTLVQVITTDIHPLTTPRVAQAVKGLIPKNAGTETGSILVLEWDLKWMRRGLNVYEQLVKTTVGRYSVGDAVTLADVCLWPEVSTAQKMGLTIDDFPIISRIVHNLKDVPAFRDDAHFTALLGE